jgi:hypothetical protein
MEEPTGYLHPAYAHSFSEFATPRYLAASEGWILERALPWGEARDGMGCYPLFACRRWEGLSADLAGLGQDLVSLVLVTDPLAEFDVVALARSFDFVKPFKCHYIADLTQPCAGFVSKHHRYYVRRSLQGLEVEVCDEPSRYVREWTDLYGTLIERHHIKGLRAFSPACFEKQLAVPGMVLFVARQRGDILGAHLVAVSGTAAYSHLAAFSDIGYQLNAAYALYWTTLEYLTGRGVRWLDLGAAAGLEDKPTDGLSWFKQGWSNATRVAHLCGRVFDPQAYAEICQRGHVGETDYFPAYRAGEFD